MKINSKHLIINGSLILLVFTFVLFILIFAGKNPNFPIWIIILTFFLFYLWFKGKSGGDIALSVFTVIFLVLYSIILGILTFKWLFKDQLGVILSLVFFIY